MLGLSLRYDCVQPVFYLGSALTSLSAVTVHLAKLQKEQKISTTNLLVMLAIYVVIIYLVSRLINWCCVKGYTNVAWGVALLPIIGVLATAFQ